MISKKAILNFLIFFLIAFFIFLFIGNDNKTPSSPYWFLLAIMLPILLRIIFPKLKELEIGTSKFFPNLYKYFKKK